MVTPEDVVESLNEALTKKPASELYVVCSDLTDFHDMEERVKHTGVEVVLVAGMPCRYSLGMRIVSPPPIMGELEIYVQGYVQDDLNRARDRATADGLEPSDFQGPLPGGSAIFFCISGNTHPVDLRDYMESIRLRQEYVSWLEREVKSCQWSQLHLKVIQYKSQLDHHDAQEN